MKNLETGQAERFARLFDGLIDYVREHLEEQGGLRKGIRRNRAKLMRACHEAVWGENGDTSLIDRFLDADSLALCDADRAEVLAWKEGAFFPFRVLCVYDEMLFVHEGQTFAVEGSVTDIFDFMETIPGTLECVLLPFDGHVTVGTWMAEIGDGLSPHTQDACYEIVRRADRRGEIIDTAERFKDAASGSGARSRLAQGSAAASEESEGVPSATEHRGALAGLSWEEREAAVGRRDHRSTEDARAVAEASCVRSVPRTIDTAIRRLKRDDLLELGRSQGLYRDVYVMDRKEAAEYLIFELSFAGSHIVADVMRRGTRLLEGLRDTCLAGGSLSVDDMDEDAVRNVPLTCEPYLYLRFRGDRFEATVIGEVYELLEDVNWDKALEVARHVDAAVGALESLVSFRGIVSLDEARSFVGGLVGKREVDFVFEALGWRGRHGEVSCRLAQGGLEDDYYIVDAEMCMLGNTYLEAYPIVPWVYDLLDCRKGIEPRDMSNVRPGMDVFDWMRDVKSYQKLVAFLDEHVPSGKDDYTFADEVARRLVGEVRHAVYDMGVKFFAQVALSDVSIADEAEARRLGRLIRELVSDVPRWQLNGWSMREYKRRA